MYIRYASWVYLIVFTAVIAKECIALGLAVKVYLQWGI